MITKTKLARMGYRKGRDYYYKTRRCRVRPENKVTIQLALHDDGQYNVLAIERSLAANESSIHSSSSLRGIRQLKRWEKFAFCL